MDFSLFPNLFMAREINQGIQNRFISTNTAALLSCVNGILYTWQ